MTQAKTWYNKASNYNIKGPPDHIDGNSATVFSNHVCMCLLVGFIARLNLTRLRQMKLSSGSYLILPPVPYLLRSPMTLKKLNVERVRSTFLSNDAVGFIKGNNKRKN